MAAGHVSGIRSILSDSMAIGKKLAVDYCLFFSRNEVGILRRDIQT